MRRSLFALIVLAASCSNERRSTGTGPVVVTFAGHELTADQVQHELSEQSPFIRSRYQSLDKKKEFLDGIVRLDLLADQAAKDGFDQDPDVQREYKRAMVQHWMRKKFNDKEGMAALPEADLRAYYDAHRDDYQRPEKLRLELVLFKADPGDTKVKAAAEKARTELLAKAAKHDLTAFAELARTRSDDANSKTRGGDLDFHTHEEIARLYGEPVATAADGLKTPSDLSPVVEGREGVYLLRLEARQPAFNRAFDQVKETLRSRVWTERRNQLFEDYVKQLHDKANVKINDEELAKIDSNRPDLSANSPPAGLSPLVTGSPQAGVPGAHSAPLPAMGRLPGAAPAPLPAAAPSPQSTP